MIGSDLPTALRAHAHGLNYLEAAVELLIDHAGWLRRDDFLHNLVHTTHSLDGTPIAAIDWTEAAAALDHGQLPCSTSEARVLRFAASLANGIPIDLRDALTGLDNHNAERVSHAVRHTTSHP
jgi:hypothetical protein